MRKLLLPILITLSTLIFAKTPDSLFRISLDDDILNYVTKNELKAKNKDRAEGYFYIRLKNPPVKNENYTDSLFVIFDKNNKIASIVSQKRFQSPDTCKNVESNVRGLLEKKYVTKFKKDSINDYGFNKWFGDIVLGTECRVFSDNKTNLFILLTTKKYQDRYGEYLKSRI